MQIEYSSDIDALYVYLQKLMSSAQLNHAPA